VLDAGRVVDRAPPGELYARPRSLASARALGPVTALRARAEGAAARTALGLLPLAAEPRAAEGLALLRPEGVRLGPDGVAATVESEQLRCPRVLVALRVGEERVLAYADGFVGVGASVRVAPCADAVWVAKEEAA
jgi:hypothetical protein